MSTLYQMTNDIIEISGLITIEEAAELFNRDDSLWNYQVEAKGDELRIYATRLYSRDNTPSPYTDWKMVNNEYGYIIIALAVEGDDLQAPDA